MIDTQQLKGAIVAAGYTIASGGKAIGLPRSTMYYKMRTGTFTVPEIDDMIVKFGIRHWEEIFLLGRTK